MKIPYLKNLSLKSNRLLYETNRWDGPLSGLMLWHGEICYFDCLAMEDNKGDRTYGVYKLSKEVLDQELKSWEEFSKYVGTHCNYDENGKRSGVVKPSIEHHKFYDKYKNIKINLKSPELENEYTLWKKFKKWFFGNSFFEIKSRYFTFKIFHN